MPRVPTSDGPQLRVNQLNPVRQQNVDVSSGLQAIGKTLFDLGDQELTKQAETEAYTAQAKISEDFDKWDSEERNKSQGANAKGYREKAAGWWQEAQTKYTTELSPFAQRMVGKSLASLRNSTLASASNYETQQVELGARSALSASVNGLVKQALKTGPAGADPILTGAAEQVRAFYKQRGLDGDAEALKVTSGAHISMINTLLQRDPKAAELHFNTYKDKQIDPGQWDEISGKINQIAAVTDGEAAAAEAWGKYVKEGDYNNPVNLYAMEAEVKELFKNDPARADAAVKELRERKVAWNESQREYAAANTNAVYQMIDDRTPMSTIRKSDAWRTLPAKEREAIMAQQESRDATRSQRAAAEESRSFTREQRNDRRLLLTNADSYLAYSDPEKLATMTRPQVQALRTQFGFEGAQHLLNRFDSLQKPGAIAEAKMDTEDFNRVAEDLGMNPYNANGDGKRALGDLKYRVEQLINVAQTAKKGTLTRDEKAALMREEMARTVTVNVGFYTGNKEVPVIGLQPRDVKNVVIPAPDRTRIAEKMRKQYATSKDPMFAPTDENLRYWYLQDKSRAASLIPNAK